ncbi:MAG TPA: hypothetical protein VES67_22505 [Vicinamibacterales bacterium]|nr:hypothetical protein [Vicinamibacterales bacterium]
MRVLFFRLRRVAGRRLVQLGFARLPDVGADWETIEVLFVLQRLELNTELEFVRRAQMRKPDGKAAVTRSRDNLSLDHHRSVVLEVNGESPGLTGRRRFVGLKEAPTEAEIRKLVEAWS